MTDPTADAVKLLPWPQWKHGEPDGNGDCRKLVTLDDGNVTWVGIRAWASSLNCWMNNNQRETATVIAWVDLPKPWGNGLMRSMSGPTLPAGDAMP